MPLVVVDDVELRLESKLVVLKLLALSKSSCFLLLLLVAEIFEWNSFVFTVLFFANYLTTEPNPVVVLLVWYSECSFATEYLLAI